MSDRPIIFSAPMVRALLEGRKTQTRRSVWQRFAPKVLRFPLPADMTVVDGKGVRPSAWRRVEAEEKLWVKEAWALTGQFAAEKTRSFAAYNHPAQVTRDHRLYRADADGYNLAVQHWRTPVFMPRWASRLTLTVTDVRIQRLHDISEEDAQAEGVEPPETDREDRDWSICRKCGGTGLHGSLGDQMGYVEVDCAECDTHRKRFMHLWNSLHGPDAWGRNRDVVAITFTTEQRNIDQ